MRDFVLLYINGTRHEIRGAHIFSTLSDYLRYHEHLTGTKIVCSEGDCGACAVLIGRAHQDHIAYRPITSCIALIYQLDGSHIITVEGLSPNNQLHPAQKAMIACSGAQCGFCTPGIVVSLAASCEKNKTCGSKNLTEDQLRLALTGNLCRCTGYEQILKAGLSVNIPEVQTLNSLYPPQTMLPALKDAEQSSIHATAHEKIFFKPTTIADACKFKSEHPACTVIAGGTDLGVLINKGKIDPTTVLAITSLPHICAIEQTATHLNIGGGATLSALEAATKDSHPELYKIMIRHGSPLIRNAGTIAGNICNGSPIGDTMPALMVLGAEVEITGTNGPRLISMNNFYTGYRKTVLKPDELLTRVLIPKLAPDETLRLYKVSKRWDLDISTFTAAFWIKTSSAHSNNGNGNGNGHGGGAAPLISDIRIAYGGVAATILRLPKTEAHMKNQLLTPALMESAGTIARTEITPLSDVRSSADFRFQLAENIPMKLYHDLAQEASH